MKPTANIVIDKYFHQCVGIDMAKDKFDACLYMYNRGTDEGCHTDSVEFPNNKHGFNQLTKWVRKEAVKGCNVTFLMEATGVYHEPLAYHLNKLKQTVYVVLPNKARDFANYEGIKTKTDNMDARCLALLGCYDRKLKSWAPPKPIYVELRQMTRFRIHLQKIKDSISNQLEALNHSQSPDKGIVAYYNKLIDKIDNIAEKNDSAIMDKVAEDKELKAKVDNIYTAKGLGYLTIITVIAETQGFNLITSRKQLASYAGLDVVAKQSGPQDPKRKISKKGNAYIRAALYFPAMSACRYNPQIKELYDRICKKHPKVKMIGLVAAMRKLLLLIYTLWKSNKAYDPERME